MSSNILARSAPLRISAVALLLLSGVASAHHGFTGAYDASQPLYLEGEVTAATLVLPHAEMTITVPAGVSVPQGLTQLDALGIRDVSAKLRPMPAGSYRVQMAGTNFVRDLNGKIEVGDRIALVALRNCHPPHEVRSRWIRVSGGEVITRGGSTQAEVDGCPASGQRS
jgi:hypothetical protein